MKEIYNLTKEFPEKIRSAYKIDVPRINQGVKRIVVVGMGGCYISGLILREFLKKELKIPIEVCQGFFSSDENDLVILLSYSGNTREVLNAFKKTKNKKDVLVLTSGGKLLESAKRNGSYLIKVPLGIHQRFTIAECFFPLLKCLSKSGLIKNKDRIVEEIVKALKGNEKKLEADAKGLAIKLRSKIPLFYASEYFYPLAYRLQTALEEDAKIICHSNKIPELFHNELEALPSSHFFPVLIMEGEEIESFKKQVDFFKRQIKDFYEIDYRRYSREIRMFLIFYFADFLGFYLSKLKNTEMGETPLSDKIKRL